MDSEKGQSLIEVIVASVVGILVVAALTFATIFSLRNANFAKTSSQATKLAQEGIERVRTGRDRNQCIRALTTTNVYSWDGNNSSCNPSPPEQPIWDYPITGGCDNPSDGGKCYFRVDLNGVLTNIGYDQITFPTVFAETIQSGSQVFRRVVLLSDESTPITLPGGNTVPSYQVQKTVTVIVIWTDFAGSHESRLVTILRKL